MSFSVAAVGEEKAVSKGVMNSLKLLSNCEQ